MKLKTLLLLFITSNVIANAQWTTVASVYGGAIANDGAVCFSILGKGYVLAGSSTDNWYEYDTLANTWTPGGSVPATMGHAFAMAFVIDNKGYIIGGDTGGYPQSTVWEFDPVATNHWTQKNNFPGGVRDAGFAFAIGSDGYAGAGFDGTGIYNDIWKYDQSHDSWTQLPATIPISGLIFPSTFVIGTNGYILTGGLPPSGVNETKKMWSLDGTTGQITSKRDFEGHGRQAAFAFSNDYFGFVGGGQSNYTTNYTDVWKYDPTNDQWSQSADAPMLGTAWSSAFVIGNTAFTGLGAKFVGTGLQGTDIFYKFSMDVTTGIQPVSIRNNISVYPNPVGENLFIHSDFPVDNIKIYDNVGRIVFETKSSAEKIFVGDLPRGYYSVDIQSDNKNVFSKILKE